MAYFRKRVSADGTVRYQAQIKKTGHKELNKTFRTKRMAENWARRIEDQIESGQPVQAPASNVLLHDILERYRLEFAPRKRSRGHGSVLRQLQAYFGPRLYVQNLTPELVIAFVDERLESVKSGTVRKGINTLSVVIDTAIAIWGVKLPVNPVRVAKAVLTVTKTLQADVCRDRRITRNEERCLLAEATVYGGPIADIIRIAISTAMRRGEICNMKAEDFDARACTLHIPQTKIDVARTIPLEPHIVRLLKRLTKDRVGPVFDIRPNSVTQAFTRIVKRGEHVDLRFHDLRHEATSRLFELGWQIQEVQAVTGHTDLKSLMRYTHLCPKKLAKKFSGKKPV